MLDKNQRRFLSRLYFIYEQRKSIFLFDQTRIETRHLIEFSDDTYAHGDQLRETVRHYLEA